MVTLMGGMGWHAFSCMYCGRASASEADGPGGLRVDKRMENLLGKWTATRSGGDLQRAVRGEHGTEDTWRTGPMGGRRVGPRGLAGEKMVRWADSPGTAGGARHGNVRSHRRWAS